MGALKKVQRLKTITNEPIIICYKMDERSHESIVLLGGLSGLENAWTGILGVSINLLGRSNCLKGFNLILWLDLKCSRHVQKIGVIYLHVYSNVRTSVLKDLCAGLHP